MNQPPRPEQQRWDPDATEVIAPLESTRVLPLIEAEDAPPPPPRARTARRAARSGPPRPALVAVGSLVVCAAVGLGIGALLAGGDGEATAAASDGTTTPPAARASPTDTTDTTATTGSEAASPSAPAPSPSPTTPPVPTGTYGFVDPVTGRAVDVEGASMDDQARVIAWQSTGQPNQRWQLTDLGDGDVEIKAEHSGLCLTATDPLTPGTAVVQRPCAAAAAQSWKPSPHPTAPGTHVLRLKDTPLVLAPAGPDAGAPMLVQQSVFTNDPSWVLEPPA
ncbi:RICIN domain-containing protein [Streptomyces apocyni]|uniref:RICIN domain-containing protein n=1 Tax=Streptomyces apocyni TaxID=2654677 RepID=UPI0018D09826|nr:RICIN domain-containing protein [Streptomyces apocyni]